MRKLTKNEYKIMKILWKYPENYLTPSNMMRYIEDWKSDQSDLEAAIKKLSHDGFINKKFFDPTLRNGIQRSVTQEEYDAWEEEYRNNNKSRPYGILYEVYEGQPTDKVAEGLASIIVKRLDGLELDDALSSLNLVKDLYLKHETDELAVQYMRGMDILEEKRKEQ